MAYNAALSPNGRLFLEPITERTDSPPAEWSEEITRDLETAFASGSAHGLLVLATRRNGIEFRTGALAFWREFADACLTALAHTPDAADGAPIEAAPMPAELGFDFTLRIPAMRGAEYASP